MNINKTRKLQAFCLAGILALTTATAAFARVDVGIRVNLGPPAVRHEVVIATPGPGHVWIPGYWHWKPEVHNYVWIEGRWAKPPHARAVWVAPRYERRHRNWFYIEGHWRG